MNFSSPYVRNLFVASMISCWKNLLNVLCFSKNPHNYATRWSAEVSNEHQDCRLVNAEVMMAINFSHIPSPASSFRAGVWLIRAPIVERGRVQQRRHVLFFPQSFSPHLSIQPPIHTRVFLTLIKLIKLCGEGFPAPQRGGEGLRGW